MRATPIVLSATVVAATLVALSPAAAEATVINDAEVTATIHCGAGNRTVRVTGAEAHLTITGHCRLIDVSGSEARIRAAVVDRISLSGSEGRIVYRRSSTGGNAKVSVTGSESKVTRR